MNPKYYKEVFIPINPDCKVDNITDLKFFNIEFVGRNMLKRKTDTNLATYTEFRPNFAQQDDPWYVCSTQTIHKVSSPIPLLAEEPKETPIEPDGSFT